MEQRPASFATDDYVYDSSHSNWHEALVTVLKFTLVTASLGFSGYFLYGIIVS